MKTVVLDLDGTMYRGSQIIQSAKEFIDYCLENKIPFIFLTNNAMRTRAQNVKHMLDMGYSGISSEQFFNSAMAACAYAKKQYSIKRAVSPLWSFFHSSSLSYIFLLIIHVFAFII